jgi:hypothetical protein
VQGGPTDGFVDGAGQNTVSRLAVNERTGSIYSMSYPNDPQRLVVYEAVVP